MCRTAEKKQDLDYYDISVFVLFEIALWVSVVSDSLYHHISVVILTIVEQSLVLYPKSLILKDLAASMEYHFHCTPCQSSLLLLNLAKTSHWLMKPRKFVTPSNSKWMKPRDIHGLLGSSFFRVRALDTPLLPSSCLRYCSYYTLQVLRTEYRSYISNITVWQYISRWVSRRNRSIHWEQETRWVVSWRGWVGLSVKWPPAEGKKPRRRSPECHKSILNFCEFFFSPFNSGDPLTPMTKAAS